LYKKVLIPQQNTWNSPPTFDVIPIPILSKIPVVGPIFFTQSIVVYIMFVIVGAVAFALYKTKWGLRTRAVGEHPTAADTVARLASSASNGDLLTVDTSTASGLKWAAPAGSGGMTLIATTTFNNTALTYTYSSLGSYKHLYIVAQGLSHNTSGTGNLAIQFNNDTGSNYNRLGYGLNGSSFDYYSSNSTTSGNLANRTFAQDTDGAASFGSFVSWIPDYAGSGYKSTITDAMSYVAATTARTYTCFNTWNNTNAITEIKITNEGGANIKTGILKLYGVS
jgi:hypothetical protein